MASKLAFKILSNSRKDGPSVDLGYVQEIASVFDELINDSSFEARWATLYFIRRVYVSIVATNTANAMMHTYALPRLEQNSWHLVHESSLGNTFLELLDRPSFLSTDSMKELQCAICFCYVLGQANRAPGLIKESVSKQVIDQLLASAMLGQHHFIHAFSNALKANYSRLWCTNYLDKRPTRLIETLCFGGIESLAWEPESLWTSVALILPLQMFCLSPEMVDETCRPSKDDLIHAIAAFEAIDDPGGIAAFATYRACCYYHLGDFQKALSTIDFLTESMISDDETFAQTIWEDPLFIPILLGFRVACLEGMGRYEGAQKVLEEGLIRLWDIEVCKSQTEQLWCRLAQSKYRLKDFDGAVAALERASLINPSGPGWERSLLFSAHSDSARNITAEFYKLNPVIAKGLESTTESQWPRFRTLSEASRHEWTFGLYVAHFMSLPGEPHAATHQRQAALVYAKVVEVELRECIFSPFRKWAGAKQELQKALSSPLGSEASELCRYLGNSGTLTLGQMSNALGKANRGGHILFNQLGDWLRMHAPHLLEQRRNIETLVPIRNSVVHEYAKHDAQTAGKIATAVLNAIPSIPLSK